MMLPVAAILIYTVSLTTSRVSTLAMIGVCVVGVLVTVSFLRTNRSGPR